MGAQLFVKMHMGPFAEQIEIEIGQDRRKAVGIFEFDLTFAVARTQAVVPRPIGHMALEQAGIMDTLKIVFVTLFVDDGDSLGIRKEDANDGRAIFDMRAEIAERIGMATFDHGIGFRRERAHCGVPSERERMRQAPASGTRSHTGRCASSYSISYKAFSNSKKSRRRSAASTACGQSLVSLNEERYADMKAATECSRQSSSAWASLPCSSGADLRARSSAAVAE